jgi:1,2-diacylglycerol 3-alpha-glucosyltransferase
MRIGLVSKWFNRGQPVVGRQIRSALDALGHETFVLARPKRERGPRPGALDRDDVWDQPGVTEASAFEVPLAEYERWVSENELEVVLCDQNYQFAELAALRRRGIRVLGRFVWEHFAPEHVAPAVEAYDLIYSLTRCEQRRYRELGIESPHVTWGCHPELLEVAERVDGRAGALGPEADDGAVWFVFPGGFLGHRKPLEPVLEAFSRTREPSLRLLIKAQVERRQLRPAEKAARRDPRIELVVEDQPTARHLERFAGCHVCLSPARWEGLGLPLYEAIAFGMPVITNDKPPMDEVIHDGVNGLLVASHRDGTAKSGIPAYSPDPAALAEAIERLAGAAVRAELAEGARRIRDTERRWELTVQGFAGLLERVA